jgi:hypothetical protein
LLACLLARSLSSYFNPAKPRTLYLVFFRASLEAAQGFCKNAEQHGSRVVLLALTDWSLLPRASNLVETSEDADAESDCDLAAAGLASVADVLCGLHRLVCSPRQ